MKDMYKNFAENYDEFYSDNNCLIEEKKFFEILFKKHCVNTVLDCACGTGQYLFMFSEMGLDVCGSDISKSMLQVAEKKMKSNELRIPMQLCDFRYLERQYLRKFDAIVCLTSALPHLHNEKDILLAFNSIRRCLNKGGIMVLSQGITHYTLTMPSIEVLKNNLDFSRLFIKQRINQLLSVRIMDLYHSENRMEENQFEVLYKIILDDDYREFLLKANYSSIEIYGDYDMNEYDETSNKLIVVARN